MKRLTADTPNGNFEALLNFVYGKDGWAHIRHDGEHEDVLLTAWAGAQCLQRGCTDGFPEEADEIDQVLCDCMMDFPECPIALAYCFASQAVHMRDRLKVYEDVLFAEDGTELITLDALRELAAPPPNAPLTLEELREMDGVPVWLESLVEWNGEWAIINIINLDGVYILCPVGAKKRYGDGQTMGEYGKTWLAYRRRPEDGR